MRRALGIATLLTGLALTGLALTRLALTRLALTGPALIDLAPSIAYAQAAPPPDAFAQDLREKLQSRLAEIARHLDGVMGYTIVDLTTSEQFGRLEDEVFPTASTPASSCCRNGRMCSWRCVRFCEVMMMASVRLERPPAPSSTISIDSARKEFVAGEYGR